MAFRRYRRRSSSTSSSGQPKYWETETPIGGPDGIRIADFVMKHFPQAGKVQTYNWLTAGGLSKGVTLHLDKMTAEELGDLKSVLVAAIEGEMAKRVGPGSPVPSSAPAVPASAPIVGAAFQPPTSDPDHFKKLFAALRQKNAAGAAVG